VENQLLCVLEKRFKEKCVPLQTDNKDILTLYVTELKYLGVHVCAGAAGQLLKFSVEHHMSTFYRTFNCIYSKFKA